MDKDPEQGVVTELTLPNGRSVAIRLKHGESGAQKVSFTDGVEFGIIADAIVGLTDAIGGVLEKCKPTKASVSFGLEVTAKSGKLLALLVEGEGKGTLNVSLEWSKSTATPS